jgi:hypothetical protein
VSGGELLSIVLTLVIGPVLIYAAKYWWEQRRWKRFGQAIADFAKNEAWDDRLTSDDLHALVATKLSDAGYEPSWILELLPAAVWFAAGRISYERRGRYVGNLSAEAPPKDGEAND